ncbi:uncharacterized protein LOC101858132 [Aplysia californica]|uniref:Uncharacterized protein LOC101858132 n=1 Tax=Aplysia californica TaxID=6500 RepID=A0ABM0K557_APLCA|nr:uncharacterized protein LOC101858132 [Aplysia californica]
MGRRKRRAVCSQRPPLIFLNSPTDEPAPLQSPDMAVENPLTAKTVPFDETIAWVSPQFRNTEPYYCQQRGRRQLRQNYASETFKTRKSKFVPLEFVHETYPSPSPRREGKSRNSCDGQGGKNNTSTVKTVASKTLDCFFTRSSMNSVHPTRADPGKENSQENVQRSVVEGFSPPPPPPTVQDNPGSTAKRNERVVHNCDVSKSASDSLISVPTHVPLDDDGDDGQKEKVVSQNDVSKSASESVERAVSMFVPTHIPLVDDNDDDDCGDEQNGQQSNQIQVRNCLSTETESEYNNVCDPARTGRPAMCGATLRRCTGTDSPPRCSQPDLVLAVDTPKGEYGLSHRQRQLKYVKYGLRNAIT